MITTTTQQIWMLVVLQLWVTSVQVLDLAKDLEVAWRGALVRGPGWLAIAVSALNCSPDIGEELCNMPQAHTHVCMQASKMLEDFADKWFFAAILVCRVVVVYLRLTLFTLNFSAFCFAFYLLMFSTVAQSTNWWHVAQCSLTCFSLRALFWL